MKPSWPSILRHNGWQMLLHLDQGFGIVVSTLFKERAFADLSLSANAYRWERDGIRRWPRVVIDALFFWQKEHCKDAYDYEVERGHFPDDM